MRRGLRDEMMLKKTLVIFRRARKMAGKIWRLAIMMTVASRMQMRRMKNELRVAASGRTFIE